MSICDLRHLQTDQPSLESGLRLDLGVFVIYFFSLATNGTVWLCSQGPEQVLRRKLGRGWVI